MHIAVIESFMKNVTDAGVAPPLSTIRCFCNIAFQVDIDLIRDFIAADLSRVFWESLQEIMVLCAPDNENSPFKGAKFEFDAAFHIPALSNTTLGQWSSRKRNFFFFSVFFIEIVFVKVRALILYKRTSLNQNF